MPGHRAVPQERGGAAPAQAAAVQGQVARRQQVVTALYTLAHALQHLMLYSWFYCTPFALAFGVQHFNLFFIFNLDDLGISIADVQLVRAGCE